jgi:ribosomal protein S27AE
VIVLVNWRDYVVLRKGEYVVEYCHSEDVLDTTEGSSAHAFVLTNQRLIVLWEKGKGDMDNQEITSVEVKKAFALESIKDLDWDGLALSVYTEEGKFDFETAIILHCEGYHGRYYGRKEEFDYFRKKVVQQIEALRKTFVIDFSFLRSLMEKGGIVLTTLKCPHCSAPIKMPKDGNQTICDHCGSMIYAQDIFEKIKALIS